METKDYKEVLQEIKNNIEADKKSKAKPVKKYLSLIKELTFRIENARWQKKLGRIGRADSGHGWKHAVNLLCEVKRTLVDPDKNLGRYNSKYDGVYMVKYSELNEYIRRYGYPHEVIDEYKQIVDEIF